MESEPRSTPLFNAFCRMPNEDVWLQNAVGSGCILPQAAHRPPVALQIE
jgi:hypothetical protein